MKTIETYKVKSKYTNEDICGEIFDHLYSSYSIDDIFEPKYINNIELFDVETKYDLKLNYYVKLMAK